MSLCAPRARKVRATYMAEDSICCYFGSDSGDWSYCAGSGGFIADFGGLIKKR